MKKKLMCLLTVLSLVISLSITNNIQASAASSATSNYQLKQETIENAKEALKSENLKKYIKQIEAKKELNTQIKIGEDLILEKETSVIDEPLSTNTSMSMVSSSYVAQSTYSTTVTSRYTLKSILGISIATLTVIGEFTRNGSTVTATDSNGTVSTSYIGWSGETVSESMLAGSTTGYSWAKAKFSLEYYIGIDPVGMTLQTVEILAKVYCNPSGSYYSEWY